MLTVLYFRTNWVSQNIIASEIHVSFCGDNIECKGNKKLVYLNLMVWMCLLNVGWVVLQEREGKNVKWDGKEQRAGNYVSAPRVLGGYRAKHFSEYFRVVLQLH